MSDSALTSASLTPQSPAMSILLIGAAIALRLVELDQAVGSALRAMTCIFGSSVVRTDRPPS